MNEITYKKAVPDDVDAIYELDNAAFKTAWHCTTVAESVVSDMVYCAFADDNTLVGYVIGMFVYDELSILRIAVRDDFKRRGIAGGLLRTVIAAVDMPEFCVWLEVRVNNAPARAFYEKMGFRSMQIRKGFYTDEVPPVDAVTMCLSIKKT
jgi:ribosomal-protein-alanine N-acetyltransferase